MRSYWMPIRQAILIFPLVAAVITIPYGVVQYRKFERIPAQKILVFYSFVFYMICAYALVILPLPDGVQESSSEGKILLYPLQSLRERYSLQSLSLTDRNDLLLLLQSREVFQLLCNLFLLLPFGAYLRYYFSCRWYLAVLASLGLSLFFEISQLTGLFFLYPEPYRCFEIDDLIFNSLGGLIGYWLEPVFEWFFPGSREVNRKASAKSCRVSVVRQLFATVLDWIIVAGLLFIFSRFFTFPVMHWYGYASLFFAAAWLFSTSCLCISGGYTPGNRICRLKIVRRNHRRCPSWRLAFRNLILYLMVYSAPFWIIFLLFYSAESSIYIQAAVAAFSLLSVLIWGLFGIEIISRCFGNTRPFLYETVSRTYCASVKKKRRLDEPERTVFLS